MWQVSILIFWSSANPVPIEVNGSLSLASMNQAHRDYIQQTTWGYWEAKPILKTITHVSSLYS